MKISTSLRAFGWGLFLGLAGLAVSSATEPDADCDGTGDACQGYTVRDLDDAAQREQLRPRARANPGILAPQRLGSN